MAADNSFDVVSKVEIQEVKNAIDQATKEVNARFDLKNSKSTITLEGQDVVQLASQDEYTIKAVIDILAQKFVKRGVSLKNLEYEKIEPASNSSVRQKIKLKQGISSEPAKKIVAAIKDSKKKAQASIQGDTVRVTSKDRDTLQSIMALLRGQRNEPEHVALTAKFVAELRGVNADELAAQTTANFERLFPATA